MTLKIVSGDTPLKVTTLCSLIYGEPGIGKTSLAFSASNPLLLDFDKGAHRSAFRRDIVSIDQWSDVAGIDAHDLEHFDTIVVDTVGRCLDVLTADLQEQNPKVRTRTGGLTLQGWGDLKASFAAWIKSLRGFGKDIILVAHDREDKRGDDVVLRADIQGGSYAEVFKLADAVGLLMPVDGERVLRFDPSDQHSGKNPAGLGPITVPNLATEPDFYAGITQQIKDGIGTISEASKAIAKEVNKLAKKIEKVDDAAGMNKTLKAVNKIDTPAVKVQAKRLMQDRCKIIGVAFDKDAGEFVAQ